MLWLKAFHLIFMVCWFAALFYLPRLFVYHVQVMGDGAEEAKSNRYFKTMESKLLFVIGYPSLVLTLLTGFLLLWHASFIQLSQFWFQFKFCLVFMLWIYHGCCHYFLKQFAMDNNKWSERFYRLFNEVPVIFLISIILLATIKPL